MDLLSLLLNENKTKTGAGTDSLNFGPARRKAGDLIENDYTCFDCWPLPAMNSSTTNHHHHHHHQVVSNCCVVFGLIEKTNRLEPASCCKSSGRTSNKTVLHTNDN